MYRTPRELSGLIKHREYDARDSELNEQLDGSGYNNRQKIESLFSSVKRKLGAEVSSRTWYRQFRDVIARMIVHNLDRIVACLLIVFVCYCLKEQVIRSKFRRI